MFLNGARVGFYCGEIKKFTEDIKVLKPTSMVVVPRLLNRIHDNVFAKVKGSMVKMSVLKMALWFKDWDLHKYKLHMELVAT